jgi:hypothetical protein
MVLQNMGESTDEINDGWWSSPAKNFYGFTTEMGQKILQQPSHLEDIQCVSCKVREIQPRMKYDQKNKAQNIIGNDGFSWILPTSYCPHHHILSKCLFSGNFCTVGCFQPPCWVNFYDPNIARIRLKRQLLSVGEPSTRMWVPMCHFSTLFLGPQIP